MSAPCRVGLIIGQLSVGGAEGQLHLLCQAFDRTRITPTVYCLSSQDQPYGQLLERDGVLVRVLSGGRVGRVRALRQALATDGVEVAHAWLFIANAYAWAATRGGPPLVTSARNCKRSGRVLDALNRRAFRGSQAIIANSGEVRDYIVREYDAPAQRIRVVHNAINLERFRPRTTETADRPLRVVMVGRLVAQKNPLLFVAAAQALSARLPRVEFQLVGDGPLRGAVEAALRDAGLMERVTLTGERRDIPELLREADLFWLTSDWEGLSNAIIEALASGLPVVATEVGGAADLITPGQEGFLVAPGDCQGFVERSLAILSDRSVLGRMGAAARGRAEAFSVARTVAATEAVYAAALGRTSA